MSKEKRQARSRSASQKEGREGSRPGSRKKSRKTQQGCIRGCKGATRKILEQLIARGWFVLRSKRHLVLGHERYARRITLPCTSSDVRAARQAACKIRQHFGIALA